MLVMGLVLGPSLMTVSIMGILLILQHQNLLVYKISDLYIPLTVCEILDIMYCEVCCCLYIN